MTLGTELDAKLAELEALRAKDVQVEEDIELLKLATEANRAGIEAADLEILNVGNRTLDLDTEVERLRSEQSEIIARLGELENGSLPDPEPTRPEGLLYSSELDGWDIFSVYGPGNNETYGSGNNSLHYHDPAQAVLENGEYTLYGVDTGEATKRFRSGAISSRETGWHFGFGDAPTKGTIRFAFDITQNEYSHAFWSAVWLRGKGGSGVHEVDITEAFTAQTGVDRVPQTIHSAGRINHIRAPWPYGNMPAGQRVTAWFECDRPGVSGTNAHVRMGIDDSVNVDTQDSRSPLWWSDDYWWDLIAQVQLGGNWVGDPRKPYDGSLQNGNTSYAKPVSEIPSWDGNSFLIVHKVEVEAF